MATPSTPPPPPYENRKLRTIIAQPTSSTTSTTSGAFNFPSSQENNKNINNSTSHTTCLPLSSGPSYFSWTKVITLDLLLRALHKTFLHPFIAWLIPLCLRAQATPYSHTSFIVTTIYATILTTVYLLAGLNKRIAYGAKPRNVDLSEEVVVVTGGASGLGQLIAQIYGMRGVGVAVLDVKDAPAGLFIPSHVDGGLGAGEKGQTYDDYEDEDEENKWEDGEFGSVRYYKCDVGERLQVEQVKARINKELGTPTILINCIAGPINGLPLLSLSGDAIKSTIQANLISYFNAIQVFLPGILAAETGGTIVTVSSVLSYLTAAGLSDYTATKAATTAIHKTLEAEIRLAGAREKVKMILAETGQIATKLFAHVETPNRFFAPVLDPVQVAREIVSLVDSGRGGVIRLPAFANLVSWYTVLPASIQILARWLSGIDLAMARATATPASVASDEKSGQTSSQPSGTSDSEAELIDFSG